jgi:TP901 family phage tail tape measure protein
MSRTVSVKLMADVGQFTRELGGRAAGSVKSLAGELDKANQAGHLDHVTNAATGLGLGLLGAAGAAIKMGMDFEKSMSGVRAATHASAGDMALLRGAAIQAGADTQYSATQAADAITALSKAGVATKDILGGGLRGALSLAAAGELDVGQAAEYTASALTQFKLQGKDVPHVADLLAAAAGKAQGEVSDMGAALNQAGLIASGTGLSIEETTGTLAAFASAGLIGSDAGTSFKTMLQQLQAPSGKTKDLMDELGISAYDAQGSFIGITQFAGQLREKLSKLTPEMRANAEAQIFGSDATRAANILYEQGSDGIQEWINKTNDSGYAAETAAMKTDNLAGDLERLKGSFDTLLIQGGSGPQSGLRVLAKGLNGVVNEVGSMNPIVTEGAVVIGALTGAALLGAAAWLKYRTFMATVNTQLIAAGPAGARAAAGLASVRAALGPLMLGLAALEGTKLIFEHFGPAAVDVDKLTTSIQQFSDTGKAAGELTYAFGDNMEHFARSAGLAEVATHGFASTINDTLNLLGAGAVSDWMAGITGTDTLNTATANMKAYDSALTQVMESSGNAASASKLWQDALERSGLDTDQLAKILPDAYAKVGEMNTAAMKASASISGMSGAEQSLRAAAEPTTDELKAQADQAAALEKSMRELFKQYQTSDQAEMTLLETTKTTNAEFRRGTKTLDLHSKAGEKNRDETIKNRRAVLDRLSAIEDMREAEINSGEKTDVASGKYIKQVDALKKTLRQMGFNRKEIDALIDKYRDIPPKVSTRVDITNEKAVGQKLALLSQVQNALKKGTALPAPARRMFAQGLATGGQVRGPGTETSDSIPALLSNDEHVWTAAEVRAAGGHGRMEKLRKAALDGDLPAYATGGAVTWPYPVTAAMTRVPSANEVRNAVTPSISGGGQTYKAIERAVHSHFPGLHVISDVRPGARTLSGNRSYHGFGRAVDYPASKDLAIWWNRNYMAQTKEFISPWNSLNIHNGRRHTYTGDIYAQHAGTGRFRGNAHDHIAMATGGVINEPVYGYGASGRSYSFGERGSETVIPGNHASAPIVVQVAQPAPGGRSAPLVGQVFVQERNDVDMMINRIQFLTGGM